MNLQPLVSVIVPAYNVEKYIAKALTSALSQTVKEIEVIVVDDGSIDSTVSTVLGVRDSRIRLYQNGENRGPSFSRNQAINNARGDWIAVLDADDWWAPNRLEKLLNVASVYKSDIICDDLYLIDDGAEYPRITYLKSRERVIGTVDEVCRISPTQMVDDDYGFLKPIIRLDFLTSHKIQYKEHLFFAEDFVFILDCLLYDAKMVIYPKPYYYYRSRSDSITKSRLANTQSEYTVLTELFNSDLYNCFPDVVRSLNTRLHKLSTALEGLRAREMFTQRRFLSGTYIVAKNPKLLIQYARDVKRKFIP